MVEVRDARPEDADGIARAHVLTWQHAYRGQLPDELLDGLSVERRAERWERDLVDGMQVVVADDDGIVGFVAVGPSRDEDAGDETGELYAIYVVPERWGQGVGRRLMDAAESRLAELGHTRAGLWVLESNERTRVFYERCGWRTDGATKTEEIGDATVTEVRYVTGL